MKVTENTTYRMLQTNLDRITGRLEDLRIQGATGIKLNKPSDDPSAIRPVLTTRTQLRTTDRYLETMGVSLDKMQATDGHLAHVENILQRAKEIGINSVNESLSPQDLNTLADEVNFLKDELLDSANGVIDGKYMFAGYQEQTKPFVENTGYTDAGYDPLDSQTWPVFYMGDGNSTQLEITPGELQEVTLTGNELFMGISNVSIQAQSNTPTNGFDYQSDKGVDVFSVLQRLEDSIRAGNVNNAPPTTPGDGIQKGLADLDLAADQNRRLRSQLGNRARRVENAIQSQETVKADLEQILSRYQDADVIETFNDIIKQETAFKAALNITAKVSDISILDYV
ncbi:flagellar hook-associated protein FlgL [Desulfopila inferna]|uniref:flagellar hook-associated protein FlgL n=1 Tax=Desulfopila inferna TaxID=468528 RepID=UPI001963CCD5|nr:flagellar hook-associated protein FlgL [Desulfopila inferna]MBM9603003.1 flagellar hook-associated protein FlgL [Desulfopila inferna]